MFGLPLNSLRLKAILMTGHEFKITTGLVPKNMLKMSPYFFPSFLQLRPTFLTLINGICPRKGTPMGPEIEQFLSLRAQSFTSLMADLCQDINRVSSFSRCLNGTFPWKNWTFPWRNWTFPWRNGTFPWRNCSVKTLVY